MNIKIFNNEHEYVIRNFDLTNCSAEELAKNLLERCEDAGWAAAHVAIIVPAAESGEGHDVIVKGTTSHMTMREVAVELMRLYGRDCGEGYGTKSQGIDATKNTMNITSVNPGAFASGFDYFCPDCGVFFSVQNDLMADSPSIAMVPLKPDFCPYCGENDLIDSTDELLDYCAFKGADPVNFYHAFPLDEPIPQSRTGATPLQVKIIVSLVILDKKAKRPVTVDRIAVKSDTPRGIVEKIFDELHITETGGTECTE